MRYVTTRNRRDSYSAQQVLQEERGAEGGLFLPETLPMYSAADLESLGTLPFTARIAQVLNTLCDTELSQWDVDFCVNRNPVRLVELPQKILLTQCWHNQEGTLDYMVRALSARMREDRESVATDWAQIAVRLSILLALFSDSRLPKEHPLDISLISGEFYGPISAWYGKSMGLPVGKIILCCNENSGIWELFHRGQLRTDTVSIKTQTPEADVVIPTGLERLIAGVGGEREVGRYLLAVSSGRTYYPDESIYEALRKDFRVSVVGRHRMESAITSVWACGTLLGPYDGLCHAGLLDHRAKSGHNRQALILSERSPERDRDALPAGYAQTEDR